MYKKFTRDYLRLRRGACGLFAALTLGLAAAAQAGPGPGPEPGSLQAVVDALVGEALAANLEFDAAGAQVSERLAKLDQARARYLPAIDLQARYTRADAGRTIDLPIGDLLNPVYAELNRLTASNRYPTIANQQIDFQRPREQQTALLLTQPLFDARIAAARAAAGADFDASAAARTALAGRLERDVRVAYYRWLQARAQVDIMTATLELTRENRRINESLFRNGKITEDLVFRAEADELEIEQALLAQRSGVTLAQSYVNLLRNRPFETELPRAAAEVPDSAQLRGSIAPLALPATESALEERAVAQRAELKQLEASAAAAAAGERLARAAFKPQLALAFEYGIQGTDYAVSSDERYALASVVLKFSFFAGGGDQAGIAGSHAAWHAARDARAAQEQQIRLQVQQALLDLAVTQAALDTADRRVAAARGGFRIATRKRDLGQINQAEFIDARRSLTDAELNLNLTRFTALSNLAELEYALGSGAHRLTAEISP